MAAVLLAVVGLLTRVLAGEATPLDFAVYSGSAFTAIAAFALARGLKRAKGIVHVSLGATAACAPFALMSPVTSLEGRLGDRGLVGALELALLAVCILVGGYRLTKAGPATKVLLLAAAFLPACRLLDALYPALLGVRNALHLNLPLLASGAMVLAVGSFVATAFEADYRSRSVPALGLLRPGAAFVGLMALAILALQDLRLRDDPGVLGLHYGSAILVTAFAFLFFLGTSWLVLTKLADLCDRETRARQELADVVESHKRSLDGAGFGAWERDLRTGAVTFSDEVRRIYGIAPDQREVRFEDILRVIHPADTGLVASAVKACIGGAGEYSAQYRIVHPDGKVCWVRSRGDVHRDESGAPILFAGVVEDVTELKSAEERFKEARESYEHIAGNIPGVVYQSLHTPDGRKQVLYLSDSVSEVFGWSREQVVKRPDLLMESVYADDRPSSADLASRAIETMTAYDWTGRIVRADGEVRWVHCVCQPVRREDGSVIWDGVVLDVTGHREAVHELKTTKERLAWILRSSPVVVYACAGEAPYPLTYLSENAHDLLGIPSQEWLSDPYYWKNRVHPDDADASQRALEELKVRGAVTIEYRMRVAEGKYRWIRDEMRLVSDGARSEIVGTAVDVTERRLAQEALRLSDERFRAMSGASPLGIFMADHHGKVVYSNAKLSEITGWPASSIAGDGWMQSLHSDDAELVSERYRNSIERCAASEFQCRMRKPGKGTIWASVKTAPMWDAGKVIGFVGTLEDVTDRHELELQSEQARIEAEKANQAKSVFLSRISHELRSPLHSILGFAELLEMDDLSDKQRESVEYIIKGGRLLSSLITEVLDFARAESGELRVEVRPAPLYPIVRDAVQMLAPLAKSAGIGVEVKIASTDETMVQADPQRLKQIVLNVISNAIKYNRREGLVTVSSQVLPDRTLVLSVRDTGPGIPPEKLERLFVPFDRLGAEDSGIDGTGLGLALSRKLAEAMGAALVVESDERIGTEVRLHMATAVPLVRRALVEGFEDEEGTRRVLIVEEDLPTVRLIESILGERPDLHITVASTAHAGIQLALRDRPDLVLLQSDLGDATGETTLRRLAREPLLSKTDIVVMGTEIGAQESKRLSESGAVACLSKPLNARELLGVVDSVLGATSP